MSEGTPVTITISPALAAVLPDMAAIWKAVNESDGDDLFANVKPPAATGALERMATETYDAMENPQFGRETGIMMIASSLSDEAKDTIVAKVVEAFFAQEAK